MRTSFETADDWLRFDREHLWHPYTSIRNPLPCYPVVGASGTRLQLADGRTLVDGMASWWCAIHGYNHPRLNAAIQRQCQNMSHVMFGGLAHEPATRLAAHLIELTPEPLQHVFLADSGSVSVEVAIKMALQFWYSQGVTGKHRLLTIRGGYHGDTFGCMSVCDPVNGMHHLFSGVLPKHLFADRPKVRYGEEWDAQDIESLKRLIEKHHHSIAAVILEPVVQGAGGMHFYSPHYLRQARALCDEFNLLLIFDEIATGFGRTGVFFAAEHARVAPDIMCVGKALTGGYMTLAATLASSKVADGISQGEAPMLMHGPTFMGNPLACAVANASIELLLEGDWQQRIGGIEQKLRDGLAAAKDHPQVADVRVLGAIGVIEMRDPVDVAVIQERFVKRGVWVRPFGRLVYIMPPYVIDDDELQTLTNTMVEVTNTR